MTNPHESAEDRFQRENELREKQIIERVKRDRKGVDYNGEFAHTAKGIGFAIAQAEERLAENARDHAIYAEEAGELSAEDNADFEQEKHTVRGPIEGLREALTKVHPEIDYDGLMTEQRQLLAEITAEIKAENQSLGH